MTNWTIARDMTDEERAAELPCFVQHADAGGRCRELASTKVYGLNFCEAHGAEVEAGAERLQRGAFGDAAYRAALLRAYPEIPVRVRQEIDNWKEDEAPGPDTVEDLLLDALDTLHKCIWTAYEDGATWLVEQIEIMRQAEAARCAYAMRELSPQS